MSARRSADVPIVRVLIDRGSVTPDSLAFAVYPRGATSPTSMITWRAWCEASRAAAAALLALGVQPGDRVAVLAGNRPLWPIADMAIQMIRAVGVGIYPTSAPSQVEELLIDSGATVIITHSSTHLTELLAIRTRLPQSLTIICDQVNLTISDDVHDWTAWCADGANRLARDAAIVAALEARLQSLSLDDLAALIYTSGSTGEPKGACISHRYLTASAASISDMLGLTAADQSLSFLPFSHAAERVFGECTRIWVGMAAALIEDPSDLFTVAADFHPTLFAALPRIFERLYEAAEVARRNGDDARAAITSRIGARCRVATSGGAALPVHIAQDLASLGLPILGAYGQTEHLCVAMNRPTDPHLDTVGAPMPGTELRVAENGEVLVRRSALSFAGYFGKPDETRAAFTDDGLWLRTGDLGAIDSNGLLRITGRVKELIALSNGRKIAPLPIEAALTATPYIAHAVCYGEGRKYLTVLLSLRHDVVRAWAREHGAQGAWSTLVHHAQLRAELQRAVDGVNATLARTDRIHSFAITDREFDHEGGELTPTLKVIRSVIAMRFADTFNALYSSQSGKQGAHAGPSDG